MQNFLTFAYLMIFLQAKQTRRIKN